MNIRKWRKGDSLKCIHGDGDLKELFGRKDGLYTFDRYYDWHPSCHYDPTWVQVKETELSYPIEYFEFTERRDEPPVKSTLPHLINGLLMGSALTAVSIIFIFSLIHG